MVLTSPPPETRITKDEARPHRTDSHHRPSGRDMKGDSHSTAASHYSQAHDSDFSRRDPYDESRYSTRADTNSRLDSKKVTTRRDSEYRTSKIDTARDPYDNVKTGNPSSVSRSHSVKDSSRRTSTVHSSSHRTVRPKDSKYDSKTDSKHNSKHDSKHSTIRASTTTKGHNTPSPLTCASSVRGSSTIKDSHDSTAERDPYDSVRATSKKPTQSSHSNLTIKGSSTHRESSSTLKHSVRTEHASSHHTSKHETEYATTERRHNLPGMMARRKTVKDTSHQTTHKPSSSSNSSSSRRGSSTTPALSRSNTHTKGSSTSTTLVPRTYASSQALIPRSSRADWDRTSGMDNSSALMSMIPSRSDRIKSMTTRTANRLVSAARKQDLDHDEMGFLVDALAEGMIKPSEFADFANFARKRQFFKGFDGSDSRALNEWARDDGDSDDDDDDEDDDRRLRRADTGWRYRYYEEITVVHFKRFKRGP